MCLNPSKYHGFCEFSLFQKGWIFGVLGVDFGIVLALWGYLWSFGGHFVIILPIRKPIENSTRKQSCRSCEGMRLIGSVGLGTNNPQGPWDDRALGGTPLRASGGHGGGYIIRIYIYIYIYTV